MGYFDQLLKQPLPSAMMESGDEMDKEINDAMKSFDEACGSKSYSEACGSKAYSEGCKSYNEGCKSYDEGCKSYSEGCKTNCEEGDDIDKELEELERECSVNGDLDDDDDDDDMDFDGEDDDDDEDEDEEEEETGSKYRMPTSVDDPTPAEPVDAEDDAEADHAMNLAATPMLLQEELTEADCGKMCESGEMDILVDEGFMMEADIGLLGYADTDEDFMEGVFAPESRPYKMTKKARFQQLYALSLQIEARAHHDPFYPKMQKAYKIERTIKKGWEKRYGALAKRRALRYLKRLSKSKSPTVKKIVNKMIKK